MQINKFIIPKVACALVAIFACSFGIKSAGAVTFNFSASCNTCTLPLAISGSPVTGTLALNDTLLSGGAIAADTSFTFAAIDSFFLTFQTSGFPLPSPDPALFNNIELGIGGFLDPFGGPTTGSAGRFNGAGDGIQTLFFEDSLGQIFFVDFGTDAAPGSALWVIQDQDQNEGEGDPISFDIPLPTQAPEPASITMFLFSIGSLMLLLRRRQRKAVKIAQSASTLN